MRRLALAALLLTGCSSDSPREIRLVPEWGCLAGTIAGNAMAAAARGDAGRTLVCPRGGPGMSEASFRAADGNDDGQVSLTELLDRVDVLIAGRDPVTPGQAPWLTEGQVRRLDPDRTGRIARLRLRELIAGEFTRADRDGSATLTPGRWPLSS
jgi:hypothetical protein